MTQPALAGCEDGGRGFQMLRKAGKQFLESLQAALLTLIIAHCDPFWTLTSTTVRSTVRCKLGAGGLGVRRGSTLICGHSLDPCFQSHILFYFKAGRCGNLLQCQWETNRGTYWKITGFELLCSKDKRCARSHVLSSSFLPGPQCQFAGSQGAPGGPDQAKRKHSVL